ncbi:hypothetical protein IFM89_008021 [Coptis chinensis]|uniref:Uncharacterized protein n=1 Tax=Coptis chinensis TaxID=261450 RepID=A0A835HUC6_9MAGN|nr:hypothetical protein IFM89_008021 [Coptis chinensis]
MIISTTPKPLTNLKFQEKSRPKKRDTAISLLQVHSLLIKTSLIHEKYAFGRLILRYASTDVNYTRKLFDTVSFPRNAFIYNTMIRAYLKCGNARDAFLVYVQMVCEEECVLYPDDFTFTFVFAACSKLLGVFEGKQAHAQMVKCPVKFGTHSWNSLMDFYVKSGEMVSVVQRVFDGIENPDIVSWNSLLDGYVKSGRVDECTRVFDEMPCRDTVSWTMMLVGCVNAGLLSEARYVFDEMPERNVVSWSAMISGYVKDGCWKEALGLFKEMQVVGVLADKVMLTSVLSACASLGALDQGCWIHSYIDKHGIEVDAHLSTALVDMYSKCGRVEVALDVFWRAPDKKVFLWNSILGGLAMHSRGKEALTLFSEMLDGQIIPNEITFICVLAACSHSGLVDDGLRIFHSLVKESDITPTVEHYGCVVDILSRAGLLKDARQFINTMPMEANGSIWRTLLGSCKLYGDFELGMEVGRILIELEPLNDANYVLMSNIYAIGNRWDDVGTLRRIMKARGVRKSPGCSSIELDGVVHEFIAGDSLHPQSQDICELLDKLARQFSVTQKDELYHFLLSCQLES